MREVVIYAENEVLIQGWPPIYYFKESHKKWCANINVDRVFFNVEKCDSADEAVARIEQAVCEHFKFIERRKNGERRQGTTFPN